MFCCIALAGLLLAPVFALTGRTARAAKAVAWAPRS